MVKHYCDRCGKEVPTRYDCNGKLTPVLYDVRIPDKRSSGANYSTKTLMVCTECHDEADKLNTLLTDIRFRVFEDYMKGHESNVE